MCEHIRMIAKGLKIVVALCCVAMLVVACSDDEDSIVRDHPIDENAEIRFPGEFEQMQGVMLAWPNNVPLDFIRMLTEDVDVYFVGDTLGTNAIPILSMAGVTLNRIHFCNDIHTTWHYFCWVRDCGPWFVFKDRKPAVIDFKYNRNRTADDSLAIRMAVKMGLPYYSTLLVHTGGNLMQDGRGTAVSDDLVLQENRHDESFVREEMRRYLGIDKYLITIDPQKEYIAHVDCWGKFLAPDKVVIARIPKTSPKYQYYEEVASYFENTPCCWGYPYKVYRIDEPDASVLAPYTNALIINKRLYMPLGTDASYNKKALDVYRNALPGYEVIGVEGMDKYVSDEIQQVEGSLSWYNTDALHCRTHEIPDFNMLFIDHRDVLFGEQPWQSEYVISTRFIAYSGAQLRKDSLLLHYRIDGGAWQNVQMIQTEGDTFIAQITGFNEKSKIDYYLSGEDILGNKSLQPVFGDLEPHTFTVAQRGHSTRGDLKIKITKQSPYIKVLQ